MKKQIKSDVRAAPQLGFKRFFLKIYSRYKEISVVVQVAVKIHNLGAKQSWIVWGGVEEVLWWLLLFKPN